jgi:general secretion pathway protein K
MMLRFDSLATKTKDASAGSEGFILVAVLWMLLALTTLVAVYAAYVTRSAFAVSANSDAIEAEPLLAAGVELAAYRLVGSKASERPDTGQFSARLAAARLSVAFQTEAARIDLNAGSKELLAGLFTALGAAPRDAEDFADRIIAWRTPVAPQQGIDSNPENSLYRSAGLGYTPRHGPFVHVDELWLVYGIPRAFVQRMLPLVTVFSDESKIDALAAAPEVIAALPGMTPQVLQAVLTARNAGGLDQESLRQLIGSPADSFAAASGGKTFRLGVRVDFDNGHHSAAEVVILLPDDGPAPYRVLSWQNAFDGAADRPLDFGG